LSIAVFIICKSMAGQKKSMRSLRLSLILVCVAAFAACASTEQRVSNQPADNTAVVSKTASAPPVQTSNTSTQGNQLPVAPAHGGAAAPPAASNSSADEQTGIDTAALDAKIAKAEEKAKAKNATPEDKKAAAAAYMERADIFMNAGRPALYKYALRDYRRTLHYQPDNQQARESLNMIVSIYQSMGRPVPELGNEP
jgi:hypothetical protein